MLMSKSQVTLNFSNLMIAHDELSFFELRIFFSRFNFSILLYICVFLLRTTCIVDRISKHESCSNRMLSKQT